ncbi:hypothetical protein CWC33_12300 [Idiomarina sp. X4]|uniref:hypothetical protein n=1 Tax=Idiomarina sp. X4 TaxID=2055892 RepID=UPI000C28375C|nr:hypothetical protein [Idiomarina sp. X4]ATZ74430.1 hypothetical protein CWC33_12300 [Idiomarina sp. X4]
MGNINRTHYHELDLILWDMHNKFVKPEVALELYEKRWGYIDQTKITLKEKTLINKLVNNFGGGVFMPAA